MGFFSDGDRSCTAFFSLVPSVRPAGALIDIDTGRICRYCKTLLPPLNQQKGWTIVAITPAIEKA